ncbi:MAG: aminotransferase class V-fold PLP-dependent enzyme [Rhodothermia bacterium]|nr:MAG: aminotransferase class V-fold PLP-dependent enzyme [Rhodothermia bacterium]
MSFDINRAREETPGCAHVIHFNNAGAGLIPASVLDAVQSHLTLEAEQGGYEAYAMALPEYQSTYVSLARLLNCDSSEIALIENATRAWDMAFYGLALSKGDKILTAHATYASNYLAMLQIAERTGAKIVLIPDDEHGQISLNQLQNQIDESVKLIALTHIPTNCGLINPAKEVGDIAKQAGIPFLLDACQSVGQIPVDVQDIGCDFLSGTGRKYLRGPRGTGFLYVRKESLDLLVPPFIDLHAATWTGPNEYELQPDSKRFENWEGFVAGKIGLGVAAAYALDWGIENTWTRIHSLGSQLRDELKSVPGITLHDKGELKGGIVTFSQERVLSSEIMKWLSSLSINVSTSSREYALIDVTARDLPEIVRASVHYYNTEEEIGRFGFAVRSVVG